MWKGSQSWKVSAPRRGKAIQNREGTVPSLSKQGLPQPQHPEWVPCAPQQAARVLLLVT